VEPLRRDEVRSGRGGDESLGDARFRTQMEMQIAGEERRGGKPGSV
jgi:hypothetical protein